MCVCSPLPGTSPSGPCGGPAPIPTAGLYLSSSQLAWLQQRSRGYLPPQVRVPCHQLGSSQQPPPVKGWPLGLCTWAGSPVRGQPRLLCWDVSVVLTRCPSFCTARPAWFIHVEGRAVPPGGQVGRRNCAVVDLPESLLQVLHGRPACLPGLAAGYLIDLRQVIFFICKMEVLQHLTQC